MPALMVVSETLTIMGIVAGLMLLWALRGQQNGLFVMCLCFTVAFIGLWLADLVATLGWWALVRQTPYRRLLGRGLMAVGVIWFYVSLLKGHRHQNPPLP